MVGNMGNIMIHMVGYMGTIMNDYISNKEMYGMKQCSEHLFFKGMEAYSDHSNNIITPELHEHQERPSIEPGRKR
eukprot:15900086-Heterocapsa_arctica.AAC.1